LDYGQRKAYLEVTLRIDEFGTCISQKDGISARRRNILKGVENDNVVFAPSMRVISSSWRGWVEDYIPSQSPMYLPKSHLERRASELERNTTDFRDFAWTPGITRCSSISTKRST